MHKLIAGLALLTAACSLPADQHIDEAGSAAYDSWMETLAVGHAPPPLPIGWITDSLVEGQTSTFTVFGPPNRRVVLVASRRINGQGACPAAIALTA